MPRKCLVIWCGDHKQAPGGLRKTEEAKAFRRKLLRRPIALRGQTEYLQPNMLGSVVLRYLEEVDDSLVNSIRTLLTESFVPDSTLFDDSVTTLRLVCQEVGGSFHDRLCAQSSVLQCLCCGWPCTRRSSRCWLTSFSVLQEFRAIASDGL